jgi:hypothetical protein
VFIVPRSSPFVNCLRFVFNRQGIISQQVRLSKSFETGTNFVPSGDLEMFDMLDASLYHTANIDWTMKM